MCSLQFIIYHHMLITEIIISDITGDVIKTPAHCQHMPSCDHHVTIGFIKYQLIYNTYHTILINNL